MDAVAVAVGMLALVAIITLAGMAHRIVVAAHREPAWDAPLPLAGHYLPVRVDDGSAATTTAWGSSAVHGAVARS